MNNNNNIGIAVIESNEILCIQFEVRLVGAIRHTFPTPPFPPTKIVWRIFGSSRAERSILSIKSRIDDDDDDSANAVVVERELFVGVRMIASLLPTPGDAILGGRKPETLIDPGTTNVIHTKNRHIRRVATP